MVSEVGGIAQLLWHLFDGECHEGGIRLRDPGTDLHPLALNQFSLHAYFFNSMMHRFTAGGIALGEGKLEENKILHDVLYLHRFTQHIFAKVLSS